jgi:hypothetical protein
VIEGLAIGWVEVPLWLLLQSCVVAQFELAVASWAMLKCLSMGAVRPAEEIAEPHIIDGLELVVDASTRGVPMTSLHTPLAT